MIAAGTGRPMTMKNLKTLAAAAGLILAAFIAAPALAAGEEDAHDVDFSFEGPFGTFDRAQLQRGYQVYTEVCATCHSLEYLSYRNLGDPGGPEFSEEQVKAIAALATVEDGPNEDGDMFERPGKPSDRFVSPFANPEQARAANGGALPPDMSLLAKARTGFHGTWNQFINGLGGPEYIVAVLTGYEEPPEDAAEQSGLNYNPGFPGSWIAMPQPLFDDQVEYSDGTTASIGQMSQDVAAFLMWTAEPKLEERKRLGFQVLLYLIVLSGLLYFVKRKIWANVEH
jgi:ubiquinol-cytochrome c reductase cytochrome b/c1 subunit